MTNLVNLNRVHKQRSKLEKRVKADQNAAKFGQSKADKRLQSERIKSANSLLDNHKIDFDK
jgi:hypothetical protein